MIEEPFTQIPNRFLDKLNELSGSEVTLMDCVYRQTLGYHRPRVPMTLTDVMQRTGLSRQSVLDARLRAMEHGLLAYEVKDGVIFWEPIIQATWSEDSGLNFRPEAVQKLDHEGEAVQILDHDGLKNRPGAVQKLDRSLNKDSNKSLKKERGRALEDYPLDFDFERLMPADYKRVPELKLYMQVTRRTPGTRQLLEIVKAIRENQLSEAHITECWRRWAVLNGYRVENLAWLVEWAPAFKAGGKPWERATNGKAPGRDAPAPKNKVSAEQLLAELEAE